MAVDGDNNWAGLDNLGAVMLVEDEVMMLLVKMMWKSEELKI